MAVRPSDDIIDAARYAFEAYRASYMLGVEWVQADRDDRSDWHLYANGEKRFIVRQAKRRNKNGQLDWLLFEFSHGGISAPMARGRRRDMKRLAEITLKFE